MIVVEIKCPYLGHARLAGMGGVAAGVHLIGRIQHHRVLSRILGETGAEDALKDSHTAIGSIHAQQSRAYEYSPESAPFHRQRTSKTKIL